MNDSMTQMRAVSMVVAYDPMLLAFPKGADVTNLKNNVSAVIGPCWGEDFEDIVVTLNGWKKNKGQRVMLNARAENWIQADRNRSRY